MIIEGMNEKQAKAFPDEIEYTRADLTDALAKATEDLIEAARAALAALKAMKG